jgi:predicted SAM-dependent methyltransferase
VIAVQSTGIDPFAGKPVAPAGLVPRLHFYGRRHGYIYAALSFVGRRSFTFWRTVAPLFARRKILRWLGQPGPQILNLGGGANTFDRWLTADIDPRADVFVDLARPLPFPDGRVDVVYLEEVIEHVSPTEARRLLAECHRMLKPGGALRLTTPCLDSYCTRFNASTAFEEKLNDIFYLHGHRHIYAKVGIRELLVNAGFASITPSKFRDDTSPFGYLDTHALRFAISDAAMTQYWDALKSG